MICAIHQLHYLPWIRYFHKIWASDVFVILDDAQFNKNGWQNRNKIKNSQGWMYLTIPVKFKKGMKINEVRIDNQQFWRKKHLHSLITNYNSSPYFSLYLEYLQKFYSQNWNYLKDPCLEMLSFLLKELKIDRPLILSSELKIKGEATERLVKICKEVGATAYLTGKYALESYLEPEKFVQEGIRLLYQEWKCPLYRQQFPKVNFIPDLSVLDLLFNEGPHSLEIIKKGGKVLEYNPSLPSHSE